MYIHKIRNREPIYDKTIGIDLGTTNSVVAVMEGGEPAVIVNQEGGVRTMAIVKVDPFRELVAMQDRIARLFGGVYLRDEDTGFRGSWTPAVDIFETDNHDLVLKAELPGLHRDDIDVTVENNTLVLKGSKTFEAEVKEENYRRVERAYGTFHRSFTLPTTVDASKVSAEYRNGVLTVKLPFRDEAKPRTINVEVAA